MNLPSASSFLRHCLKAPRKIPAVLVLLLALVSCDRGTSNSDSANNSTPQQNAEQAKRDGRTESAWIVQSIIRDIADMAAFASNPQNPPLPENAISIETLPANDAGHHYKVVLSSPCQVTLSIDITGSIWDSTVYQAAAHALLEALQLGSRVDRLSFADSPVKLLTVPLAKNIQAENIRVSNTLNAHPLSPEAHEQAALVVGVLGLRENSGVLWDTRGMNNRATAHLALAKALRGNQPLSDTGELAELLTSLEADTKKDSDERIARLKARSAGKPELAPWIMAAQLRNTRDWRLLTNPAQASLLERIEFFRAYSESVSPDVAAKALLSGKPEAIPDWANIVLQLDFSVAGGHTFAARGLGLELQEISEVFPASRNLKLSPESLAQFLNKEPGRVIVRNAAGHPILLPIDEGMWAHYYQRHLCHLASRTDDFLRDKWSVPDQAAKFEASISQMFSKLTFSPVLHTMWNTPKHPDQTGDDQTAQLIKQHPEWITESVWKNVHRPGLAQALQTWYSPGLPVGTAYRYASRAECVRQVRQMNADDLRKLFEMAPWQFQVAFNYMKALYGEKPKPEQAREVLSRFLDFKMDALLWCAYYAQDNPVEYTAAYERAAEFDPDYYLTLASYYHTHQMDEKGVRAMELAQAREADAVSVAHQAGWVVNYYYDHGQKDRALALAKFAAEVYSRSGLEAMATLQERMGNASEAESYFEKIKERYNDAAPLAAFYKRQGDRQPGSAYAAKFQSNLRSVFPKGLEAVTLQNFTAPPQKGVQAEQQNDVSLKYGLKSGDIIVAIDGMRVENLPQYSLVREFTRSPHVELIVYQNGQYRLLKNDLPDRKFGISLRSWP